MQTVGEWWMWLVFLIFIFGMIAADMFLLGGRKAHQVSFKEALYWSISWFILAIIFNGLLWIYLHHNVGTAIANQKSIEFFTGYLIEKSLSVDNIFVILMIFNYFAVPAEYQRRVLIYGVLGAIIMRMILILIGVWAVSKFQWLFYFFGVFLLITGIKMFVFADKEPDLEKNLILRWIRKHLRVTESLQQEKFFVRYNTMIYLTPLFLVLVLVEISDLIFAVDSIPAVFAITNDPFIVFTSNIFAILGLRALYFLLHNMHNRFHLLKYALAFILVFIGCKMLLLPWMKIPIFIALSVVILSMALAIICSIWHNSMRRRRDKL